MSTLFAAVEMQDLHLCSSSLYLRRRSRNANPNGSSSRDSSVQSNGSNSNSSFTFSTATTAVSVSRPRTPEAPTSNPSPPKPAKVSFEEPRGRTNKHRTSASRESSIEERRIATSRSCSCSWSPLSADNTDTDSAPRKISLVKGRTWVSLFDASTINRLLVPHIAPAPSTSNDKVNTDSAARSTSPIKPNTWLPLLDPSIDNPARNTSMAAASSDFADAGSGNKWLRLN